MNFLNSLVFSDVVLNHYVQVLVCFAVALSLSRLARQSYAMHYFTNAFFCIGSVNAIQMLLALLNPRSDIVFYAGMINIPLFIAAGTMSILFVLHVAGALKPGSVRAIQRTSQLLVVVVLVVYVALEIILPRGDYPLPLIVTKTIVAVWVMLVLTRYLRAVPHDAPKITTTLRTIILWINLWLFQIILTDLVGPIFFYNGWGSHWVYFASQVFSLVFVFMLVSTYVTSATEASLSIKLSLSGLIVVLGALAVINPMLVVIRENVIYPISRDFETAQKQYLKQYFTTNTELDRPTIYSALKSVQYITARPHSNPAAERLLYVRDSDVTFQTVVASRTSVPVRTTPPTYFQSTVRVTLPDGRDTDYGVGFIYFDTHRYSLLETLIVLFVYLGATLIVMFFFPRIFRSTLLQPLSQLLDGVRRADAGDLTVQVPVRFADEIGTVTQSFNAMVASVHQSTIQLREAAVEIHHLNDQLKAENRRMSAELDVTRRLQQMILPADTELIGIPGLEIAGYMEPADEVGGDYYDVLHDGAQVKIGIGDVTGHGLESGVVMIMVQAAVRALLASDVKDPSLFLSALNHTIYGNVQRMGADKSLTLALLDYNGGHMRISGQHEEVIVVRADGGLAVLDTINLGFPLGLTDDIADFVTYCETVLDAGDVVVLYTDGITEAQSVGGQLYGIERLCATVVAHHSEPTAAIRNAIIADVKAFIGTGKVYDDISLLVLKQVGAPTRRNDQALD